MNNLKKYALAFRKIFIRQLYIRHYIPNMVKHITSKLNIEYIEIVLNLYQTTLSYVNSNYKSELGPGFYSYTPGGLPLLYSSCYAALIRHLYGNLDFLSDSEKSDWITCIQCYQTDDGLFRDPNIDCLQAELFDWWGWRHLTVHALMALSALGGIAKKPFGLLHAFRKPGSMATWLKSRQWKQDASSVSNEIQNYGTMLQYARDFQGEHWCDDVLNEMYEWLDQRQDPRTGYWAYGSSTPWDLSLGVQTGYHLWCLYFYDRRPVHHIEQIIDSCLTTQNRFGGFGVPLNSSACEDIDSIYPLVCLSSLTDYRKEDIEDALARSLLWIITNSNADGGWVFRRGEDFRYGHDSMWARANQSSMFPTWFRTLSLAYLSKILTNSQVARLGWRFIECPGYQFWR